LTIAAKESAGTIMRRHAQKFLFLVQENGKAMRYGIRRPAGFHLVGVKQIFRKKEWPAWTPPPECLCGAPICRATWKAAAKIRSCPRRMYLGSSLLSHPRLQRAPGDRTMCRRAVMPDGQ